MNFEFEVSRCVGSFDIYIALLSKLYAIVPGGRTFPPKNFPPRTFLPELPSQELSFQGTFLPRTFLPLRILLPFQVSLLVDTTWKRWLKKYSFKAGSLRFYHNSDLVTILLLTKSEVEPMFFMVP